MGKLPASKHVASADSGSLPAFTANQRDESRAPPCLASGGFSGPKTTSPASPASAPYLPIASATVTYGNPLTPPRHTAMIYAVAFPPRVSSSSRNDHIL